MSSAVSCTAVAILARVDGCQMVTPALTKVDTIQAWIALQFDEAGSQIGVEVHLKATAQSCSGLV